MPILIRFAYRAVALFFFVSTFVCWFMALVCAVGLIADPDLRFLGLGIWSVVLALLLAGSSRDAWRAARYY